MNPRTFTLPVIWLIMVLTTLPALAATSGGSVRHLPPNAPEVRIDAHVMTIDLRRKFLYVGEQKILVSRFQHNGQLLATRLLDFNGRPIPLAAFKSGQRVLLHGYHRPGEGIVAASIQLLPPQARIVRLRLKPLRPVP